MFSELIFKGEFEGVKIGADITNSHLKFELIKAEEGDIPSLHNLNFKNDNFEITVYKNVIIGIAYNFEYKPKKTHEIVAKNTKCKIGYRSNINEFLKFLNENHIENKMQYSEKRDYAEITIIESNISFRFVEPNYSILCKFWSFDINQYNEMSKKAEEKN